MASIQIEAAAKVIMTSASAAAAQPLTAAAAAPAAAIPGDFCKLWAAAKPVIQTAAAILAFINPAAAGTLQGLIKIGDQIAQGMGCT
jgi:hypothetical protein